jgi:AraC-like DNA-binding protein
MHILLITILDRQLEEAVRRFCALPYHTSILNYNVYDQILLHGKMFLLTYIQFLQTVGLLPQGYSGYHKRQFIIHESNTTLLDQEPDLDEETREAIRDAIQNSIRQSQGRTIPVYHRYNNSSEMMLISGMTIRDQNTGKSVSLLHQTGIPLSNVQFTSYKSGYLITLLEQYERNPNLSVRQLASKSGRSYKQLQKECRLYFGTTFHSFFLKLRMLHVITDVMFTGLSLKEIAFKNDFSDYSNMYRRFKKQYQFTLQQVPRFLNLI